MNTNTAHARARNTNGRFAKKESIVDTDDIKDTDEINARYSAFKEMFGVLEDDQQRRPIWGAIVNIVVSFIGGFAAGYIATVLAIACALLTGSVFLAYCVYVLSIIAGLIAAMRAGAAAGAYVAYGKFESDYQAAKGWVKGKAEHVSSYLGSMFNRNAEGV